MAAATWLSCQSSLIPAALTARSKRWMSAARCARNCSGVEPTRSTLSLAKLTSSFVEVLKAPDLVERFAKDSVDLVGSTPEQFRAHLVAEIQRFERAVKAAGIKLD